MNPHPCGLITGPNPDIDSEAPHDRLPLGALGPLDRADLGRHHTPSTRRHRKKVASDTGSNHRPDLRPRRTNRKACR